MEEASSRNADARLADSNRLKRRSVLALTGGAILSGLAGCAAPSSPTTSSGGSQESLLEPAKMYKSPTCSCCDRYAEYLRSKGDDIRIEATDDTEGVKERFDVPTDLRSCHTVYAGEYVIEGHVPRTAIEKLYDERPALAGIAVPGMPAEAPGMGDSNAGELTVYAFTEAGETEPFVTVGDD